MTRRGWQKGTLRKVGPSWFGEYSVYGPGRSSRRKTVKLGSITSLSRDKAKVLLVEIVAKETSERQALARMSPAVLSVRPRLKFDDAGRSAKCAIGELLVSADLLARSYVVCKPINPFSEFDLLYLDGDQAIRVEVKWVGSSDETSLRHRVLPNLGKFDVLALVYTDGTIEYRPGSNVSPERNYVIPADKSVKSTSEIENHEQLQ